MSLAVAPTLTPPASAEAPRKATVLVVDDVDENREILGCFLQGKGYQVLEAPDGEAALRIIAEQPIDLVVLDEMMPGLSGTQVLERVRRRFERNRLPVIMATAKDGPDDVVRALALGANDYVVKPMDLTVLLARAETQLSVKQSGGPSTEDQTRIAAGDPILFGGSPRRVRALGGFIRFFPTQGGVEMRVFLPAG